MKEYKLLQARVNPKIYKEFKKIMIEKNLKIQHVLEELLKQFIQQNKV